LTAAFLIKRCLFGAMSYLTMGAYLISSLEEYPPESEEELSSLLLESENDLSIQISLKLSN
jgi:hypothetical protein